MWYGLWCGNRLCIFYWYYEENLNDQIIKGIPLSGYGLLNFIVFDGLVVMSLICHLRAAFADPGLIPKGI